MPIEAVAEPDTQTVGFLKRIHEVINYVAAMNNGLEHLPTLLGMQTISSGA